MNKHSEQGRCIANPAEEARDGARVSTATDRVCNTASIVARRHLSAEELGPLTRIVGWRSAAAVLQTWLAIAITIGVALTFWSWPLAVAAAVIVGTQQHALFILSHDAAHYRLFDHRGMNDLVGRACAAAVGLSMCTYRVIHRLHHNHLYGPQDPDMPLHGGYPRGKFYLMRKLIKDLSGLTAAKSYSYFFGNPATNSKTAGMRQPLAGTTEKLRIAAASDQKIVLGLQLALPIVFIAFGGWQGLGLYLLLWVLPALTVLQAILRLRAVFEHGAVKSESSPLTAARTHAPIANPSWLLVRLALFPHHVNFHIEHHLYPSVPHYHLPRLHRLLASRGLLAGSEVRTIKSTMRKVFDDPVPIHIRTAEDRRASVGDTA